MQALQVQPPNSSSPYRRDSAHEGQEDEVPYLHPRFLKEPAATSKAAAVLLPDAGTRDGNAHTPPPGQTQSFGLVEVQLPLTVRVCRPLLRAKLPSDGPSSILIHKDTICLALASREHLISSESCGGQGADYKSSALTAAQLQACGDVFTSQVYDTKSIL